MNKNNLLITGVASLVALVAVTGVAMSTFASEDDTGDTFGNRAKNFEHRNLSDEEREERKEDMEERRAEREERRTAVMLALDANDYAAWVEAEGEESPLLEKITEENFSRFVEAHELRQEAKSNMEEADSIFEELGIEKRKFGSNMKGGRGGGMHKK